MSSSTSLLKPELHIGHAVWLTNPYFSTKWKKTNHYHVPSLISSLVKASSLKIPGLVWMNFHNQLLRKWNHCKSMSAVLNQVLQWTMVLSYYFLCICKYTQSPVKPRLAIVKNQKHDVFTESWYFSYSNIQQNLERKAKSKSNKHRSTSTGRLQSPLSLLLTHSPLQPAMHVAIQTIFCLFISVFQLL